MPIPQALGNEDGTPVVLDGGSTGPANSPTEAKQAPAEPDKGKDTPKPGEAFLRYDPTTQDKWIRDAVNPWNINDKLKNNLYSPKSNLKITISGSTKTAVITADYVSIAGFGFATVSLTCTLSSNGENGLDTGSFAASKAYALYLITDVKGAKLGCIAHVDNTNTPTLPAGYTIVRRIGWCCSKNDASNLQRSDTHNDWTWFYAAPTVDPVTALLAIPVAVNISGRSTGSPTAFTGAVQAYYDPC